MALQVKVLAANPDDLFDPWNPHSGKREPTLKSYKHTHSIKKRKKKVTGLSPLSK